MASTKVVSATACHILMLVICCEFSQTEAEYLPLRSAEEQEVASCILKIRETEKRVRNEVTEELKKELEETFGERMQKIDLLETEIALERTRQQVIEQKVELSYKGLMRLENALTKCTGHDAPPTTTTTLAPTTTAALTTTKKPGTTLFYIF